MRSSTARLAGFLRGNSSAAVVAQVAITNGLMLCLNVLTGIVTARTLKADGRGELAAILLWPQLLGWAFSFSMPPALFYHANKDPASRGSIVGAALAVTTVGGLVALCVGELVMPFVLRTASSGTVLFARYMMIFAPFGAVSTVLIGALQLEGRFRLYNRLRYLPVIATLAALLLLAWLHRMKAWTAALAYLLPGIPVFAGLLWWVLRQFRPSLRGSVRVAPRLLVYGARAYGGDAAGTLVGQLDKVLLVNLLTPAHYGIYVVVFNLSRVLTTFSSAVAPVLLPRSAGKSAMEVMTITSRALTSTIPILAIGAAAFIGVGSMLLRFWYGMDFASGYFSLCLLIIEAVLGSVAYIAMQPFLALNRPGVITVIQALSLPLMGLGFLLLVPRFGLNGAAAIVLATTAFRAAATFLAFGWILRIAVPRVWPKLRAPLELLRRLRTSGSWEGS